jgi:hypothetical protein
MPKLKLQQTSFTAGEVSPQLKARIDVSKYYSGAERMRNVVVLPLGGFRDRSGTRLVAELADWGGGGRLVPFAFNTEQAYLFALTGAQFRVWRNDALVATVASQPWTGAQARESNRTQSADTLLLFHKDLAPWRILRGGSHASWTAAAAPLANLPTFDFGSGAEPVISAARGWPRCASIYQGRLYMGGLRARPSTIIGSKVGQYFDFAKGTALDDEGINVTIDDDQVNAIYQIASGRHLQVFSSGGAFAALVNPPITPKNVALDRQIKRGIREFVPTVEVDGATLYVERSGQTLREFVYDYTEAAYLGPQSSLLAPHLIRAPVALAAAQSADERGADYVYIVNDDGTVACLNTLRGQEIAAYTLFETDGKFRDVAVLDTGETYFVVERTIAGSPRFFLEKLDRASYLDAAVVYATGFPISIATGLGHLEGKTVQIVRDGYVETPQIVSGGQVTLAQPAASALQIGLDFDVRVQTLPAEGKLPDGSMIGRKARALKATLRVSETSALAVNGVPRSFKGFSTDAATPLDAPPPSYTGDVIVGGLQGWKRQASIEISRPFPGSLCVLGVAIELAVSA